ncbi:MAG: hypothetical protein AAGF26_00395 [Cyanobacteria bacterium P01_G01_bin.49]
MRKVARVETEGTEARWLILYQTETDVYLFPCASDQDGSSVGDEWYASVAEAEASCAATYGVTSSDWVEIADPLPGCQADWLSPVRVSERNARRPEWVTLEHLAEERWVKIQPQKTRQKISDLLVSLSQTR